MGASAPADMASGILQPLVRGRAEDDVPSQAPPAKVVKVVRASFLERFFAKYEFKCRHMLSCSDCEAWKMSEVLEKADADMQKLWNNASLGYTESLGDPLLLQEIRLRYRDQAVSESRPKGKAVDDTALSKYDEQNLISLTACFSQSEFDQISDLLGDLKQECRPILFSDEMYSDILESRPSNVAKPNSIVLSGLSKPWGMPGLRVGWLLFENSSHFEKV